MTTALTILACSALTLSIIAGVFRVEDAREGDRVVLGRVRSGFDWLITMTLHLFSRVRAYLAKSIFRLMFHYSAHKVLKRLHLLTQRVHNSVEKMMRQNKQKARTIRSQKQRNHLDEIAEHKEETALSEVQKEKMRSHE